MRTEAEIRAERQREEARWKQEDRIARRKQREAWREYFRAMARVFRFYRRKREGR